MPDENPPQQAIESAENPSLSTGETKSKREIVEQTIQALTRRELNAPETPKSALQPAPSASDETPWILQQFFNGEIDLVEELSTRFPNIPVMSVIHFRSLGKRTGRGVATLVAQDGSAQMVIDADKTTKVIQMSFTLGSMLTLKFTLNELSDLDRSRWLELMRRDHGGMAFLWGPSRWESDYLICVSRKYFINFYAFSPHNFEAAIRMTPDVIRKLLEWLEEFWQVESTDTDVDTPDLLTW